MPLLARSGTVCGSSSHRRGVRHLCGRVVLCLPHHAGPGINQFISKDCYSGLGIGHSWTNTSITLADRPYRFSNTCNKFVSIGCETQAYLVDNDEAFCVGCTSVCNSIDYVQNESYNGVGCCKTSALKGMANLLEGDLRCLLAFHKF